jgi:L-ascorbate oxidase
MTRSIGFSVALFTGAALSALAPCVHGPAALAQGSERIVAEPPSARIQRTGPDVPLAGFPPAVPMTADAPSTPPRLGEAAVDLNIQYTEAKIYNPGTDQYDSVKLRSYRDARETNPPKVPFVAPTVEIFPGETVRITLNNKLPAEPNCAPAGHDVNTPNCFNRTNLHAHGLWVSPVGNGDNVLLSINPGVSFQYEYNVALDHPAGTFWYHPHRHGSTALQVSSGMAGVLVIKGTRLPSAQATGDIDTLLKHTDGAPYHERLVLLQQIQYACRDAGGEIKADAAGLYLCAAGDIGGIEDYSEKQFGPGTWRRSGRYTSINGEVLPTFAGAQSGRIERWRVVHAGVRDTVKLQFKKMRAGAEPYAQITGPAQEDWLSRNCPGTDLLPHFGLATDGLTRAQLVERTVTTLQPGYREDLLIVFAEAGDYCVLDGEAAPISTVNSQTKSRRFLGKVTVAPGAAVSEIRSHIQSQLIAAADAFMPPAVRQKVRDDLANGLRLASFIAHPDIADGQVTGKQNLQFKINTSGGPVFQIDGKAYDPNRIDRTLPLGGVDEWTLTSGTTPAVGHPFHMHVNPFQVVRILAPNGSDVSVDGEANDKQYAGLKGAWRDTLFVKAGYQVIVRTRYQRYIGDFVLHCHILDHEDQGMMQNIRIALPDGMGGVAPPHH